MNSSKIPEKKEEKKNRGGVGGGNGRMDGRFSCGIFFLGVLAAGSAAVGRISRLRGSSRGCRLWRLDSLFHGGCAAEITFVQGKASVAGCTYQRLPAPPSSRY